jgi:hypothetical protein
MRNKKKVLLAKTTNMICVSFFKNSHTTHSASTHPYNFEPIFKRLVYVASDNLSTFNDSHFVGEIRSNKKSLSVPLPICAW